MMTDRLNLSLDVKTILITLWFIMFILQSLLSLGTAYRCTKNGNDNGMALFIYLIGFNCCSLIPCLGLYYYIKYLPPKQVIVHQHLHQQPQPQVIRTVEPPMQQMPQQNYQSQSIQPQDNNYQK